MHSLVKRFKAKPRSADFFVRITLRELINVPLVSGEFFAKWSIKNGNKFSGTTYTIPIADFCVRWDHVIIRTVTILIDKNNRLEPCMFHASVEQKPASHRDKHRQLGSVSLNLSEYVGEGAVIQRHLLQDSKVNSTLKVAVEMNQVGGETDYISPKLRKTRISELLADVSSTMPVPDVKECKKVAAVKDAEGLNAAVCTISKTRPHTFWDHAMMYGAAGSHQDQLEESVDVDMINDIFFPQAGNAPHSHPL